MGFNHKTSWYLSTYQVLIQQKQAHSYLKTHIIYEHNNTNVVWMSNIESWNRFLKNPIIHYYVSKFKFFEDQDDNL